MPLPLFFVTTTWISESESSFNLRRGRERGNLSELSFVAACFTGPSEQEILYLIRAHPLYLIDIQSRGASSINTGSSYRTDWTSQRGAEEKYEEAHGVEPWTYRTAADCSTTELYLHFIHMSWNFYKRPCIETDGSLAVSVFHCICTQGWNFIYYVSTI